jgi:HlyD family secretion protein
MAAGADNTPSINDLARAAARGTALVLESSMDIARPDIAEKKRKRRRLFVVGAALAVLLVSLGLSRLRPALPTVDSTVLVDEVKRGPMVRQVRGLGTLVPVEIRWIGAATDGRVERIVVLPGTPVKEDTVLIEMSNPEVELAALDAVSQLRAAEAQLAELKVRLESQRLDQEADLARFESEYRQARLKADADEVLAKQGLVADVTRQISALAADETAKRATVERQRLSISGDSIRAQLAVQEAAVEQRRALARLRQGQLEALKVRAGLDGMLQQVPVEVGQRVTPGTNLARISQPDRLKAVVRIPETQARDVQIGQAATIDTRNGIVNGKVSRIDPAVQNGTVTVDVALPQELPRGARPDLTVDGTIELERLANVLYVGRPAQGQPETTIGLFRVVPGTNEAQRVTVQLGRASVTTVEVRSGLSEGDRVVLSDMSAWDAHDRVRIR